MNGSYPPVDRVSILKALTGHYTGEAKRNITFSLPERLINEFKEDCDENGVKMNQVVQIMLDNYLHSPGIKDPTV